MTFTIDKEWPRPVGNHSVLASLDFIPSVRKERAEFSYLSINIAFLLFEALDGGYDKFVCEFWSRHVAAFRLPTF